MLGNTTVHKAVYAVNTLMKHMQAEKAMIGEKNLNSGTPAMHNVIIVSLHVFEYENINLIYRYKIYNIKSVLCLDHVYLLEHPPSAEPKNDLIYTSRRSSHQ
jgi:hypothetical protein